MRLASRKLGSPGFGSIIVDAHRRLRASVDHFVLYRIYSTLERKSTLAKPQGFQVYYNRRTRTTALSICGALTTKTWFFISRTSMCEQDGHGGGSWGVRPVARLGHELV